MTRAILAQRIQDCAEVCVPHWLKWDMLWGMGERVLRGPRCWFSEGQASQEGMVAIARLGQSLYPCNGLFLKRESTKVVFREQFTSDKGCKIQEGLECAKGTPCYG